MDFYGQAKTLSSKDVTTIAGYLGCEVAAVRAVLEVEARNSGFDQNNRPKMLFEPHIFWRELGPGAKRDKAKDEGLAYSKWKRGGYPANSYPRLLRAMAIDETTALCSASWGMGQVMGFNHKAAGFDTVQEFVRAMTYSEGAQLYAMARFVVFKGLQRHLKAGNWSSFAKGYNGASYAKHGYHTRLKAAYEKRPSTERNVPPPASELELNMLLGLAVPPEPQPKPELKDQIKTEPTHVDYDTAPKEKSYGWLEALIGVVFALGAAVAGWFAFGG